MSTGNEVVQLKVAQLYQAITSGCDTSVVKMLLEKDVDINWIIPAQYSGACNELDFECTMLHVAYTDGNIETFKLLLEYGANFTIQNQSGSTILHHIFLDLTKEYPVDLMHLDDSFIAAILSAHVRFGNSHNPSDKNGLSHFHISCMANHLDAVKFFLCNGALTDQSVNVDSSLKSGYSPLHFAAEFLSYETVEFIISNGANVHLANADGLTPLYLLIKERLKVSYCQEAERNEKSVASVLKKIELYDKIVNLLLMNDTSSSADADLHCLTHFHVACTLQDSSIAVNLSDRVADVNHAVRVDSPICPGYTALHFAASCNSDTVKALMKEGADLRVEDKEGVTPLDICMRKFKIEEIQSIISSVPRWKNIRFSDNRSKLVDCILAMKNPVSLEKFLQKCNNVNVSTASNSPIWPGYTPLHLAVLFSDRFKAEKDPTALLELCLDRGAHIHAQDKRGWTPLHLAFRRDKSRIVDFFFKIYSSSSTETVHVSDEDNLSYVHISCTEKWGSSGPYFCTKLLSTERKRGKFVNAVYKGKSLAKIKSGWTPLHVAVVHGSNVMQDRLLDYRADCLLKDDQGFTVIHRLLGHTEWVPTRITSVLEESEESKVQNSGLTHLHMASWLDKAKAVRQLLEKGSDIEATIEQSLGNENLDKFVGCTPLHVAMMNQSTQAVKELLQWGADVFAKMPDSTSPLSQALTGENERIRNLFVLMLWDDAESRESMKRQLGLTMLHLACHTLDLKRVRVLLGKGVDVNAKVRDDSNVWPGCTPLHVLMRVATELNRWEAKRYDAIFDLLLTNGADVIVMDARQSSPLEITFQDFQLSERTEDPELLLKHHLDYKINPMDKTGLSYFHLVCSMNNFEAIEKFLEQGIIDVNRPIGYFASVYPGCSPLHLAVRGVEVEARVVKLLLDHGADGSIEDIYGDTPLHDVISFLERNERLSLMKALLGWPGGKVDVNARNFEGETAMEILLRKDFEVEELKLLLDEGGSINTCNPITYHGHIATVLSSFHYYDHRTRETILQVILKSVELSRLDEMGRNAIHNSVTLDVKRIHDNVSITFIAELIKMGCNIDHRDNFGNTALHLAVQSRNRTAVCSLLKAGADINIVDLSGKSAFSYVFKDDLAYCGQHLDIFTMHVEKLKFFGIEVSVLNNTLCNRREPKLSIPKDFVDEVRAFENMKVGRRELTLRSFFYETGAVSIYPSIAPIERKEIATFFVNILSSNSFPELRSILLLQFRKAENRLPLVAPARSDLRAQLKFPLPDLCLDIVLKYLSNSELKNLIAASSDDEDMRMIVDL